MARGDVVLLVIWCAALVILGAFFELPPADVAIGVVAGGLAFAVRLYLARRSFRR